MDVDLDKSAPIDILNISHDDVLQLYRGWRRSEGQLKDKNKELTVLRKRMEQLQDAHVKFHGQIQALKSVKELTVNLQTQLSYLQQENNQLTKENAELRAKKEDLEISVSTHAEALEQSQRESQIDLAVMRGRVQEMTETHEQTDEKLEQETTARIAVEKRLEASEQVVSDLRVENFQLQEDLNEMRQRVIRCDDELAQAANQLKTLSKEVESVSSTQQRLSTSESEVGILRGDISRLLHLLEHSGVSPAFVNHWKDSKGMTFIGLHDVKKKKGSKKGKGLKGQRGKNENNVNSSSNNANSDEEPRVDASSGENEAFMSSAEYAHLQRMYGGDPFPITESWNDEIECWAPNELVNNGVKFVERNMPHVSKSVILGFINGMNKIWLRREKRKIQRVKERFEKNIQELHRQMAHSKPYREVMAEASVRRLKTQVYDKRVKHLHGRPKRYDELSKEERDFFDAEDEYGDMDEIGHGERKLCKLPPKGSKSHIRELSANKLLVASLESLEYIGKTRAQTDTSTNYNSGILKSNINSRNSSPRSARGSPRGGRYNVIDSVDMELERQPTEEYLRGALWLGRNFVTITEELCSNMEALRLRSLKDVNLAMQDNDKARACNRLSLVTNSVITEYTAMAQKSGYKSRGLLQVMRHCMIQLIN